MRITSTMAATIALLLLGGCFTMQSSRLSKSGDENVFISNHGWYLFGVYPIATGNAEKGARSPTVFFRNDVTLEKIQSRMLDYASEQGKEIHDLAYHNHDSVLLNVPGLDFPLPIPYLLTYREIQLSGVVR